MRETAQGAADRRRRAQGPAHVVDDDVVKFDSPIGRELDAVEDVDDRSDRDGQPAHRFVVTAAIVRHLQEDPLLPASLLPARWPGTRLRVAYAGYEQELGDLLRQQQTSHG